MAIVLTLLFRFGLFALLVATLYANVTRFALTFEPSSWYFGRSTVAILVFVGIAVYGFYISLGGRALVRDSVFEERGA